LPWLRLGTQPALFINPELPSDVLSSHVKGGHALSAVFFPSHADLGSPRRHLGVFSLAHEVQLGGADVAAPGEFPNSRTSCICARYG
jgi:hypothetical protein